MSDGTFGTTQELGALDETVVEQIEAHRFDPLDRLFWRSSALDFASPHALQRSLDARSPAPFLIRAREAEDQLALAALLRDHEIAEIKWHRERVRLLWEICQIPDFRKTLTDSHARFLGQIFRHLTSAAARLPEDWTAEHVARLDSVTGDIDTLTNRIAHVRTWTYIAHRADWLPRAAYWQERTRAIEDQLSDALHERLTQRFIDRRAARMGRGSGEGGELLGGVTRSDDVVVEGHRIGRLEGFSFVPESAAVVESRTVLAAARRALGSEIGRRVQRFAEESDSAFTLRVSDARVLWHGVPVARLARGDTLAGPKIEPLSSELIDGDLKVRVRRRLEAWLAAELDRSLQPLTRLRHAPLSGSARGVAFQLIEAVGVVPRSRVEQQLSALSRDEAQSLTRLGVRLGAESVFLPSVLKPATVAFKTMLWSLHNGQAIKPPPAGAVSLPIDAERPEALDMVLGFRQVGPRAIRVDQLERLSAACRRLARQGGFTATPALRDLAGCAEGEIAGVLKALGYRAQVDASGVSFAARRGGRRRRGGGTVAAVPTGPFARLGELVRRRPR